jgi:uncharacterized protein (TIGR02246 family)
MNFNKALDVLSACLATAVLAGAALLHLETNARADPAVAALITSYEKAWNTCDAKALAGLLHTSFTGFMVLGGPDRGPDNGVRALKVQCNAGYRANLRYQILDQALQGDATLVVASVTGTMTLPTGETRPNPLRVSFFLVRDGATAPWRIRHTHMSSGS